MFIDSSGRARSWLLGAAAALVGCQQDKAPEETGEDPEAQDSSDTGQPEDTDPLEQPSADRCERALAGPGSSQDPVLALSAAHASVRLFGPADDFLTVDAALVAALEEGGLEAPNLAGYAAALDLCLLDAADPLGPASARDQGGLAWVRPGTGEVALPEGATGVVIDLRDLPADPALAEALSAAVAPALATEVSGLREQVRRWSGFADQVFSRSNAYRTTVVKTHRAPLTATGSEDLPLVLVTDRRLAPEAAAFAATLASAGRAWIVGEDVLTEVAELSWSGLDGEGLFFPSRRLQGDDGCLADTLAATLRTADAEGALDGVDLSTWEPPPTVSGACTRDELPKRTPYDEDRPGRSGSDATFAADLIVAHGVLRRFFPYFDTVGDELDPRLLDLLEIVPSDREGQLRQVGALGEALHDGHVFFGDLYGAASAGYLPVLFDHLDGRPVVVQSLVPELAPGDAITAVNGTPIADLYALWSSYHGAATMGYATDLAGRELQYMDDTTTYTVEDPDGVEREEVIDPQPVELLYELPFVFHTRANGRLDDLDAPEIAYLNLASEVTTDLDQVEALIADAATADGLVVDMRGYPGVDIYTVASLLHTSDFSSPLFRTHVWTGSDALDVEEEFYSLSAAEGAYAGPIVLLTSPITVSAAENFSMMLVDLPNLTRVGRQSAGTNGNITGMMLPGGYYLSFTGMEVLFPDGDTFHGVGIVPDVEVVPTAADYRDGLDPELVEAIRVLRGE